MAKSLNCGRCFWFNLCRDKFDKKQSSKECVETPTAFSEILYQRSHGRVQRWRAVKAKVWHETATKDFSSATVFVFNSGRELRSAS